MFRDPDLEGGASLGEREDVVIGMHVTVVSTQEAAQGATVAAVNVDTGPVSRTQQLLLPSLRVPVLAWLDKLMAGEGLPIGVRQTEAALAVGGATVHTRLDGLAM